MPHSPAQLSSQRSLPEPPSSPPHSPSQNPPSLRIPALIPDPICPLPNSLPPTPPHTRFLPARILGSIGLFSLGFLSRTQPGLSKSCRGAFQSPVSTLVPAPLLTLHGVSGCCPQPSSPSPTVADPPQPSSGLHPADLVLLRNSRPFLKPSPSFPPAHQASKKKRCPGLCQRYPTFSKPALSLLPPDSTTSGWFCSFSHHDPPHAETILIPSDACVLSCLGHLDTHSPSGILSFQLFAKLMLAHPLELRSLREASPQLLAQSGSPLGAPLAHCTSSSKHFSGLLLVG